MTGVQTCALPIWALLEPSGWDLDLEFGGTDELLAAVMIDGEPVTSQIGRASCRERV